MLNSKKIIMVLITFIFVLTFCHFDVNSYATNIDWNLAQEHNVTDDENPGNNIRNSTTNPQDLDTNTATNIENIDSIDEYNEPTSSFGISEILNILLLAVGLVIILLAVAILIRLGK